MSSARAPGAAPGVRGARWPRALAGIVGPLALSLAAGVLLRALGFTEASILLAFLLGVALVAFLAGRLASVVASLGAVLAFNFFFVHPLHTFAVSEAEQLFNFAGLLVTGLTISELVARQRSRADEARAEASRSAMLTRVAGVLGATGGRGALARAARAEIECSLGTRAALLFAQEGGGLEQLDGGAPLGEEPRELAAAAAALRGPPVAGPGFAWLAVRASDGRALGVLGIARSEGPRAAEVHAPLAAQVGLALEREEQAAAAQRSAVAAEAERTRADLLATVSHDMRTPLAAIGGIASALLEPAATLEPGERDELLREVLSESRRMAHLVENLLQLARMDEARPRVRKDWFPFEEVVGAALARLGPSAEVARVRVELPSDLPLVPLDVELAVQMLANLLDNALRYAPGGPVELAASRAGDELRVVVRDHGPGLEDDPERLFGRFVRGAAGATRRGSGLGLSICRAIAAAHGGRARAENAAGGGARFLLELPLEGGLDPNVEPEQDGAHGAAS